MTFAAGEDRRMTAEERARAIKLIVLDVDGILTDGRIIYTGRGDDIKLFDTQDGMGMSLWWRAGGKSAILSARRSATIKRRAKDMHIDRVYQSAARKLDAFELILRDFKVVSSEVAYMGDDVIDIPVLKQAGLAAAASDSVNEVKAVAHYITQKRGGRGAVRELTDMILRAQGRLETVLAKYYA